ncbi:hypothetical protein [Rhizobium phaseoli]|uniref:hypothetical protein n=1 Tax=Rhizobium phaseoli TaxID=396 RepID=UPI001F2025D4|nr:hypothetical protein [Rhizobium phaseoli]
MNPEAAILQNDSHLVQRGLSNGIVYRCWIMVAVNGIAVPFDHEIPEDGWRPAAIIASGLNGDIDVFKTQDAVNALNNRAAKAAALAAACQGTAIALPILQDLFHALV